MTRDEVMALSGRELDAAVAERVKGWEPERTHVVSEDVPWCTWLDGMPCYSSTVLAAWKVVEQMDTPGSFRLRHGASGHWWASFGGADVQGNTPGEAICRAVLIGREDAG